MSNKKNIACTILILCMACCSTLTFAQQKPEPFEYIRVGLAYHQNTNQNYFHDYWSGKDAFQIDLETPFYAGEFFINGRYASFSNLTEDVPSFNNYQVSAGWGMRVDVLPRLKVGGAFGGIFSMFYYGELTEDQITWVKGHLGSISSENEAGFIFTADISYEFWENWGLRLSANRNLVYTHSKIKLNYVGLGVYREFKTPGWLQEFLK